MMDIVSTLLWSFFWIIFGIIWIFVLIFILRKLLFEKRIDSELQQTDRVVLLVKTHTANDKKEDTFEALLTSLHAIIPHSIYLSLEIASTKQFLHFYITSPKAYASMIQSQLYTHFPNAEIEEVTDYAKDIGPQTAVVQMRNIGRMESKTYKNGMSDFLKSLSGILSSTEGDDRVYLQFVLKYSGEKLWEKGINQ